MPQTLVQQHSYSTAASEQVQGPGVGLAAGQGQGPGGQTLSPGRPSQQEAQQQHGNSMAPTANIAPQVDWPQAQLTQCVPAGLAVAAQRLCDVAADNV